MFVTRLLGSLRILKAAIVFPITTFATCLAGSKALDFWPTNPWRWQYSWVVAFGLPLIAFLSANAAFRNFGATGGFGKDPVADFRDVFRRILVKHIFACIGFLVPQFAVSIYQNLDHLVVLASLLFVLKMVSIDEYVGAVMVERVRYENGNRFKESLGERRGRKATKGVRRK